jgi:hypothetical protein
MKSTFCDERVGDDFGGSYHIATGGSDLVVGSSSFSNCEPASKSADTPGAQMTRSGDDGKEIKRLKSDRHRSLLNAARRP